MSLDATIGGDSANSYVTVAEADGYFADRHDSGEWDAITSPAKDTLLILASRTLDWRVNWIGLPLTDDQAMEWPRKDKACKIVLNGTVDDPELPDILLMAVYETAYNFLESGDSIAANDLDSIKLGRLTIDFNEAKPAETNMVPDSICLMISDIGTCKTGSVKLRQVALWR